MTDPLTSHTFDTSAAGPPRAAQPAATERAGPGTVVGGRYTLRAAVGHGGMGTVWRATDTQLGRSVAVKEVVTPPGIAPEDRDAMYQRMLREARAAAVLSHPGVVQVYDVVTDSGRPWIVMELLDARSLSDMVLEDGPLAPRAVAKIGVTLLGALEVAHAAGVLHRDVKPANVLVCTDGRCVLTDFGVARMPTDQQLTTPGMVLGSPHFISPERALGASFGPPSDLFSLGVTLYCAVEGKPPFDRGEPIATMHSVVEDEPRPPYRAGVLTEVLYGLLEKNPDRRWDAPTARAALRSLLAGPLASRTPQFPTDPYAVVPAQRLPWQETAAAAGGGAVRNGQIGGRALLSPGEQPTDRTDPYRADPYRGDPHRPDPYRAGADPYRDLPDPYQGAGRANDDTVAGAGHRAVTSPTGDMPALAPGGRRGLADGARQAGAAAVAGAQRLLAAMQRAPRRATMLAAGGLATVVLIAAVWMLAGGGDEDGPPPQAQGGGEPAAGVEGAAPLIPVQEFADRGMAVNVPEGWEVLEKTEIRVDYVDPGDPLARIRLLTEPADTDSRGFVNIAEQTIQANCPEPYQRIDLIDIEVDGHPAAQLDYRCGDGDEELRTRWVTTVRDGIAYSFFLRVAAAEFDDRVVIFEELLRSFRVV